MNFSSGKKGGTAVLKYLINNGTKPLLIIINSLILPNCSKYKLSYRFLKRANVFSLSVMKF